VEHEVQTKDRSLALYIALLVALFVAIVGLFALLKGMAPTSWEAQIWDTMTTEKTVGGTYQMRMLDERERTDGDVRLWMDKVLLDRALVSDLDTLKDKVYWLYLMEEDYYVLYLPGQDRTLGLADITVSEETEKGGSENTLVIRARTSEKSQSVVPEEQLFAIKTNSETWRGIRLSIILDGREKEVRKLVAKDGGLYSTEEVYIGRF
jgi:hypothetical protein